MRLTSIFVLCLSTTAAIADVTVLPSTVSLSGPEATHRLLVEETRGGEVIGQVTEKLTWSSSDAKVVKVKDGLLTPVGNGDATVTVKSKSGTASTKVTVREMSSDFQWTFRNHVLPVLSKVGCNSGACHGALAGKGGFKLSLRGYDPHRDHFVITRQAHGRRIEPADPGRSLLLSKPSGALPHKGGIRFATDSRNYRVLAEWIAHGAEPPQDTDPRLDRVEVLPSLAMLKPGQTQQMLVRAHYSDGRVEDVTDWVKFSSTNEAVARVNGEGKVEVIGNGEGAVTAWFSSKIAIARITSPFAHQVPERVYQESPRRNFIDELTLKQLRRLNLKPSPRANDATFIRRAFLDTIGTLPTEEETTKFLADPAPDKRDRLIDLLLERPEFVDYWTYKWSDMLLINGNKLRPEAVKSYYKWLHGHVEQNTPWDKFAREVLTAQGGSFENGATNFYAIHQDPETMTENACQAFLGLSIACAKCHNHPLEKWTNNQYYAMANLFSRVRLKGWGGDSRNGDGKLTVYVAAKGELIQPLTGKPQPPTPLDGESISFDDPSDRRVHLANWLTSPENPYFARSITNRVWANYLGVGLVESVDDMRTSNPASNEELLTAAADYLIKESFNLKSLMRAILRSETYQRGSQPIPENKDEKRFYSRYYPKRLMAEVLLDAVSQVTAVPSEFNQIEFPGADRRKTDFYPKGTRAIQLYDSAVRSYFLKTFGRNPRDITCECERSNEPSMVQVLHLSNGNTLNDKLAGKDNAIQKLLASGKQPREMIEQAYLLSVSRFPTEREREQLAEVLSAAKESERRVVLEDVFWALLTSREFLFNH